MTTHAPLRDRVLELVDALSHQHGACWATERALRSMLSDKLGRRVGERSIARVLRRLAREGVTARKRVLPCARVPWLNIRKESHHGTTVNVKISRQERRAEARKRAKERRRAELAAKRPPQPTRARGGEAAPEAEEQVSLAQWLASGNTGVPDAALEFLQGALTRRATRGPPPD